VNHAEDGAAHPVYAHMATTEDGRLLFGVRWTGEVEIS
jgi:hypothetical protein